MSKIKKAANEQPSLDGVTPDVAPKTKTTKNASIKVKSISARNNKTDPYPAKDTSAQPSAFPTYYLPISQLRAQVFLAHGLIYPARYDFNNSRPIIDAQSRIPGALELWPEQPPISKGELLFGVRLLPEEVTSAVRAEDAILLTKPLPVSRLVEIAVPARSTDEVSKFVRGWIESDVPVPEALFMPAQNIYDSNSEKESTTSHTTDLPDVDCSRIPEAIARYDRIMGMFAFMKNAARYHSARLGLYADYPAQLFRLAGLLHNSLDPSHVPDVKPSPVLQALMSNNPISDQVINQLCGLVASKEVYLEKSTAKTLSHTIQLACGNDANVREAFSNLFDEDYKAAIRLLQKEPVSEQALLLAVLFKFSDRQSNDHRNIKQTLHEDWASVPPVASMLGMLGAYYGYTALDARESRIYSVDRRLTDYIDHQPPIKFHLESLFERELIEAIYQWTFNDRKYDLTMAELFEKLPKQATPKISPISSRNSVPPSACSKRPRRCAAAPVKAPRS